VNDQPIDDSMPVRPPALPPLNVVHELPPVRPEVARWRWWVHLLWLSSYPLAVGLVSSLLREGDAAPALSGSVAGLLMTVLQTYIFFGFFFGLSWLASRANTHHLMLEWRNGRKTWLLGLGYGVGLQIMLRIILIVIIMAAVFGALVLQSGLITMQSVQDAAVQFAQRYRPETEKLVDGSALVSNPVFLILTMTLVSFAMAGFTEELWRAGVLAGFRALFPRAFASRLGQALFVVVVAAIFGAGHAMQGIGAVVLTGIIGIMLGAIMLFHRSMWIAALAHGFFDAFSFLTLYFVQANPQLLESLQKLSQPK
jgi:membrane protease YdiL (CAAX protease family)